MDDFNDANLTPDQLKMLTLQFMGQHLTGDLKNLEQNIVAKNNTLQGMILNPAAVINSIPTAPVQHAPQPQQPQLTVHQVQQSQPVTTLVESVPSTPQPALIDQNQLEFSFETSPLSERIFESLQRIEKKLSSIDDRLLAIEDNKKKD
jgi:hypothetical protein